FFFQAEDGIRDRNVTGVQTCALPISFVSKAIGLPLAKVAMRAMLGHSLEPYTAFEGRELGHIAVKESVFPFVKFPGVDAVLGPEDRKSTRLNSSHGSSSYAVLCLNNK